MLTYEQIWQGGREWKIEKIDGRSILHPEEGRVYPIIVPAREHYHPLGSNDRTVGGVYVGRGGCLRDSWPLIRKGDLMHKFAFIGLKNVPQIASSAACVLLWNSDGEDGPSWPAGFGHDLIEDLQTPTEREYLMQVLKRAQVVDEVEEVKI